jgi:predicted dinucleotide-binding enzyme
MIASMMKTGIIGIGSIGSAVATGLARVGHPVVISRRGAARSTALAAALKPLEFRPDHVVIPINQNGFCGG